eukprot:5567314-Pyramimonas_sp.AAC.1
MREQYDLWKGIRPSVRLFRFKVLEVSQLDSFQPLQQFSNRKYRGLVTEMEMGQPERLLHNIVGDWPHDTPSLTVRLPAPYA